MTPTPHLCPIRQGAERHPEALALSAGARRWSYAALDADVAQWTALLERRGVGEGDRVAVLAGSHPLVVPLFFALGRLRAVAAPLNARLTASELSPLLQRLQPRLTLALEALRERLPGAESLEALAEEARALPGSARREALTDDAERVILFTSGTTGVPKGAVLTEGNFRAAARASAANLGARPAPRWLGLLPLFHVGGLTMLTRSAYAGGALLLHERFDAAAVNRAIDEDGASHASFVATTLERVLDARGDRPVPPSFRLALLGGGPVPPPLVARARAVGLLALQTYGLTEACAQAATERPDEATGQNAGRALPGLALRVVGADGAPLPAGAEGEIEVRGPTVMKGYFRQPEATREALRDGWLRTRDVGVLDSEGRLTVLSRRTDLLVCGGENVYPAEIEAVLAAHPAVREAAVGGVPDPRWGQVPVAAVALREGHAWPGAEALEAFCRARLAGYKVPRRFLQTGELPRNAMGKVDRVALRALLGA
ncbi:o-succinylbenzoate--CoA ligase [Aggregicoccus sp. 17bor-14]|uniref:o-succinylbenzoate--CoA ligase n=1 Tax=Myxococcaceae TaxID=31 RepID=UPI0012F3B009|nr:o-succinylbenzoate--CoA ligase [Simulacricoccus sp. 17bor-14]MRI89708.1 o-succinylbenzoate--CoA ligase [Aggregicoccus sp. 17bor-14]